MTTSPRPPTERTPCLSELFWDLADAAARAESRDSESIVRHASASILVLQGITGATAAALEFLVRLENEPRYASPEQSRGGQTTSRSLVYSLGVLLFERLTGHHPFADSCSPNTVDSGRDGRARPGTGGIRDLPARLREILHRAMSPFADDRFADIGALNWALEEFVRRAKAERRTPRTTPPPCPGSAARHLLEARAYAASPPTVEYALESDSDWQSGPESTRCATLLHRTSPTDARRRRRAPWDAATQLWRRPTTRCRRNRGRDYLHPRLLAVAICALAAIAGNAWGVFDGVDAPQLIQTVEASAAQPAHPPAHNGPAGGTTDSAEPAASDEMLVFERDELADQFDTELAGQRAALAAVACLSAGAGEREVPVTLRFPPSGNGASDQVHFSPRVELSSEERVCLASALVGIAPGGPPSRVTLATYTLRVPTSSTVGRLSDNR